MQKRLKPTFRRWLASLRETRILVREFAAPLLFFFLIIFGGGALYYYIALLKGESIRTMTEAVYLVLTMTFLQAGGDFPNDPALQIFYFIMPVAGLSILAQGLTDFGIQLFNRRLRSREWEIAVASTLNQHHILVGLGHLGYRVVQYLHDIGEQVAVVELDPKADLAAAVQKLDVPLISGDSSRDSTLLDAGIQRAQSIILCVQDDALNLKTALKARSHNPDIKVIIRIFDDEFGDELHDQFGFNALSGTAIAAPAFAAAAAGADITNSINVEGESFSLVKLTITPKSKLDGKTVGQVEDGYGVSIVLVRHDQISEFHPTDSTPLHGHDLLAILGRPDKLSTVVHASR